MWVNGVLTTALVDTGSSRCIAHVSCCSSWKQEVVSVLTVSGKEHFCKGTRIVRLHLRNGASAEVDVLVVDSTLLGFSFILGMNGIVALGGATVSVERLVRFGKEDTTVCAAAATVIGVDEQDFSAAYDAATNSWTAMWKWSQGVEPGVLQNQIEEYSVPREARLVYEKELEKWIADGWLVSYEKDDSVVKEGTSAYIDDILVNEDVVTTSRVEQHLARYGLTSKTPARVADGARVLGLRVWGERGSLHWKRDNKVGEVPSRLTRRSVFSYCGRLLGHFPVCGWLRVAVAFIKRKINHLTSSWDEVVIDDQLKAIIEETANEVRKNDPVRGRWDVKGSKARVWVDASSLTLGVMIEAEGCIIEDASWLRKDDASHINMAELDAVVKGLNLALAWQIKEVELLTDSSTVF
ncbi:hypothetical protein GWK47_053227 [Chionoecetes opilio]|uniref:DUF7047 domain-containing protein n=1 Tax=Chionoecetes opilio TaxID=41210 RepID=A0A8J5C992_CHIOP|nr:hypothetical protein GWK47_053227 [Chionoecetes opilio]